MSKFTQAQLATWVAYEAVRKEGSFNMFSKDAINATGLTTEEYFFVMTNFSELKEAVEKEVSV